MPESRKTIKATETAAQRPLYKHLPRGPQQLDRDSVARHQKIRMHGAMVASVIASGYAGTTVKDVITLAGVSRRSFYEQFDNKLDCFLLTLDLIANDLAARVRRTSGTAHGSPPARLAAAFAATLPATPSDWDRLRVLILHGETAGRQGLIPLMRATATVEEALGDLLEQDGSGRAPAPVARAIVGGMHGILAGALRRDRAQATDRLGADMLSWTRQFFSAHPGEDQSPGRSTAASVASTSVAGPSAPPGDRDRMCEHMLRWADREGYVDISLPRIADLAGVPLDHALRLFRDRDACFLAALDWIAARMLERATVTACESPDWPCAAGEAITQLIGFLAEHPDQARALTAVAPTVSAAARERIEALSHSLVTALVGGVRARGCSAVARDATAGAIWQTIRYLAVTERVDLVPAYAEGVSRVVITSFSAARG